MKSQFFIKEGVPTVQVKDPRDLKEFELIDVRTIEEFHGELGYIEGAKLITLGEGLEAYLKCINPHKKIVFICRSGARSSSATIYAQSLGLSTVYNLEGGMLEWNNQGFSICKRALGSS